MRTTRQTVQSTMGAQILPQIMLMVIYGRQILVYVQDLSTITMAIMLPLALLVTSLVKAHNGRCLLGMANHMTYLVPCLLRGSILLTEEYLGESPIDLNLFIKTCENPQPKTITFHTFIPQVSKHLDKS